jgi:hypothetical protein
MAERPGAILRAEALASAAGIAAVVVMLVVGIVDPGCAEKALGNSGIA